MGGGGVDGAIHRAGGKAIPEECRRFIKTRGRLPTGQAMITSGGNLPAKYVIHTVGPVWNGGSHNEKELLSDAYYNSLKLAVENKIRWLAFPNISTGAYGFPKELAAGIAIATVKDFIQKNAAIEKIVFVCFDNENFQIYQKLL